MDDLQSRNSTQPCRFPAQLQIRGKRLQVVLLSKLQSMSCTSWQVVDFRSFTTAHLSIARHSAALKIAHDTSLAATHPKCLLNKHFPFVARQASRICSVSHIISSSSRHLGTNSLDSQRENPHSLLLALAHISSGRLEQGQPATSLERMHDPVGDVAEAVHMHRSVPAFWATSASSLQHSFSLV
mmetsp:Transcript_7023/g.22597  ORF Transcript_7023/g.22597 Transcript_7023/m.22597 type:complete len:184 (+) Transcript_7023:205-756(+)